MVVLIKNGYVVNPAENFEQTADILIEDGRIKQVAPGIQAAADKVIHADNMVVLPGLVDMHVHLRDPGFIHKEDILTGCEAAAAGGVTSLLCMPNTKPVVDSKKVVEYIKEKAQTAKSRVYITGAISKRLNGEEMCDYAKLKKAGIIALSDDGRPVKNAKMMTSALKQAKELGLIVTSHCEDLDIINGGIINEGEISRHLGVKGMHRSSEDYITAREIILAETNHCPVHIAHVSTRLSVQLIREAKARGAQVTAETCPHYFDMTEQELLKQDADYRMNPPLREEEDRKAVEAGVLDGTLDCIVTDHAPHTAEEKRDFLAAPNGVIGMETSFAASYTHLVKSGKLSLMGLVRRMSLNPANILGIPAGTLNVGAAADIAIVDLNEEWTVDVNQLHSRSKNAVYKGRTLTGKVKYTLLGGKIVFDGVNRPE
ncbi:MAG: dihydroorotase [Massiliimalia sp.]|jgi:dihydroorotase